MLVLWQQKKGPLLLQIYLAGKYLSSCKRLPEHVLVNGGNGWGSVVECVCVHVWERIRGGVFKFCFLFSYIQKNQSKIISGMTFIWKWLVLDWRIGKAIFLNLQQKRVPYLVHLIFIFFLQISKFNVCKHGRFGNCKFNSKLNWFFFFFLNFLTYKFM